MFVTLTFWDSVISFFDNIWEFFQMCGQMIVGFVNTLLNFVQMIGVAFKVLPLLQMIIPGFIYAAIVAFVCVGIVRSIIAKG